MKMHILTDNRAKRRGILAEHGLSIFIENGDTNILFDTGQSDVYVRNAALMNVDLSRTGHLVLSHGHYDHCGGLIHFPKTQGFPRVYAYKASFARRYAMNLDGESYREIGIPWRLDDHGIIKDNITFTGNRHQIAPDIHLLAEIPSTCQFEEAPAGFYLGDEHSKSPDRIIDEQMLILDTGKAICLFLGCSHPGIVNCLSHAMEQFPGRKIDMVVAGMHLDNASEMRLNLTIRRLIDSDIRAFVPLHCTGVYAICEMKRALGNRCLPLCAGDTFEF